MGGRRALALPARAGRRGAGPQPAPVPPARAARRRPRRPLPRGRPGAGHLRLQRRRPGSARGHQRADAGDRDHRPADQPPLDAADRRRRRGRPPCGRPGTPGPLVAGRRAARPHRRRRRRDPRGGAGRRSSCARSIRARHAAGTSPCSPGPTTSSPGCRPRWRRPVCRSPTSSCGPGRRCLRRSQPPPACRRRRACASGRTTSSTATTTADDAAERRVAPTVLDFLREQPLGDGAGLRGWLATMRPFSRRRRGRRTAHVPRRQGPGVDDRRRHGRRDGLGAPSQRDDRCGEGGGGASAARRVDAGVGSPGDHVGRAARRLPAPAEPTARRGRQPANRSPCRRRRNWWGRHRVAAAAASSGSPRGGT